MTGSQHDDRRQLFDGGRDGPYINRDSIRVLYAGTEWGETVAHALDGSASQVSVSRVADCETARTKLASGQFDCVIAEYSMPDAPGTELLETIADERSEFPTVLLASSDAEPGPGDVIDADVSAYFLVEEVDPEFTALRERVETLVRRDRLHDYDRLRTVLDIAEIGAWEYDAESETLWWSEAAREIYGLPRDGTVTQEEIADQYTQESRQRVREAMNRAFNEGRAFDEIVEFDSPGAQWIRVRGQPEEHDGSVRRVRGSVQDVTDLVEREEQFRMLHSAGQRLLEATSREEIAEVTIEAAKNILGYARAVVRLVDENEEVLRVFATTDENIDAAGERPDYRVDEDVPASRTYRRGEPEVLDDLDEIDDEYERGDLRSGLYAPVGDHGVFSCGDLDTHAYDETDVTIVQILTRLSAAALNRAASERELRQKKDQLEQFTGVVAHDLRSPLSTVFGRVELAQQNPKDQHFEKMKDGLLHMESMIEELLTLAKAGEAIEAVEAVSLADAAHDAWKHAQAEGLDLVITEDVRINADRERLLHVLENLFRNAIDHNDPPVTLRVGRLDDESGVSPTTTGFFVEDDGRGISPADRGDVFDHGYTTDEEGTGFGLSIVRHVADAHNWGVDLTDSRDGGVRFEFTNVELASNVDE